MVLRTCGFCLCGTLRTMCRAETAGYAHCLKDRVRWMHTTAGPRTSLRRWKTSPETFDSGFAVVGWHQRNPLLANLWVHPQLERTTAAVCTVSSWNWCCVDELIPDGDQLTMGVHSGQPFRLSEEWQCSTNV